MPSKNNLKNFKTNKNYDLLKVKNTHLNVLGFSILFSILIIVIITNIIYYLNRLKYCPCFQNENLQNKTNLDYLIFIEIIGVILNLIIIIHLINLYLTVSSMKGGNKEKNIYLFLVLFLYTIVYAYFIYFVYKLSQNIKYDCLCSQSPIRFFLYAQAIIIFINLLIFIFGLINL